MDDGPGVLSFACYDRPPPPSPPPPPAVPAIFAERGLFQIYRDTSMPMIYPASSANTAERMKLTSRGCYGLSWNIAPLSDV